MKKNRKISLNVEALRVDSFATDGEGGRTRGTVRGLSREYPWFPSIECTIDPYTISDGMGGECICLHPSCPTDARSGCTLDPALCG